MKPSKDKKRFQKLYIEVACILLLGVVLWTLTPTVVDYFTKQTDSTPKVENTTDTTPPQLSCNIKTKTISTNHTISIKSLGVTATDSSKIESIAFTKITSEKFYSGKPEEEIKDMVAAYKKGISMQAEEFRFSYGGFYTLTITATDEYQNASEITVDIIVETPPIIEAPEQIYIASGTEIKYTDFVSAWDLIDEDFSAESLEINAANVNHTKPGTYTVTFTATDHYGLSSTKSTTVNVYSATDLQDKITKQEINMSDHIILGAKKPYDAGCFSTSDIDKVQTSMRPILCRVKNGKSPLEGNGFIIDINDSFVTIATNEHLIRNSLLAKVYFFDGTVREGQVVASNAEKDIAFIRLPISETAGDASVTPDIAKKLRAVHIDYSDWKALPNEGATPICCATIRENGELSSMTTGTMVEKTTPRSIGDYTNLSLTTVSFHYLDSLSGAPLFDSDGCLIGMLRESITSGETTETVAVPLKELLDYYERVFKARVELQ